MSTPPIRRPAFAAPPRTARGRLVAVAAVVLGAAGLLWAWPLDVSGSPGARRGVSVSARRYEFAPARIVVDQDDVVKIDFTAEDIPHSFVIDEYRISKRASAGQTVTFEFRADQAGTFPYYCSLAIDDGCRKMHGELVVRARK